MEVFVKNEVMYCECKLALMSINPVITISHPGIEPETTALNAELPAAVFLKKTGVQEKGPMYLFYYISHFYPPLPGSDNSLTGSDGSAEKLLLYRLKAIILSCG